MLPDLRIVIAAVVSTFIFTVGVGFFASSRLIHEQMTARVDTKGLDDTPINRIALNWPEPTKFEPTVDLDFAVSAKASKNPVRDITPEIAQGKQAPKTETSSVAAAPTTVTDTVAQPKEATRDPAPVMPIAKAPNPIEETSPAPLAAAESATDTHVIVHPDPMPEESTGSIAAPATSDAPTVPIPESRPKFAMRSAADGDATVTAKPAIAAQAKTPVVRKKRPRKTAAQQRWTRAQPAVQIPQFQPFDFFGLFSRSAQSQVRLQAPAQSQ